MSTALSADRRARHSLSTTINVGCTTGDAIGDLPPLGISEGEDVQPYTAKPSSAYQKLMRASSKELYNHVAPFLSDINRKRLTFIPEGGSWRDLPFELLPEGMKRAK